MKVKQAIAALLTAAVMSVGVAGIASATPAPKASKPATQTVVDMNGRTVTVPTDVTRIADTGTDPVINSLLFMFGGEKTLVNAITTSLKKVGVFESTLDPQLLTNPTVETTPGAINYETLASLNPQIVFTNNLGEITPLTAAGFTVIYVTWTSIAGLEQAVQLCGKIFGMESLARKYIQYFNAAKTTVANDTKKIPSSKRLSVLYLQSSPLEEAAGAQIRWWGNIIGVNNLAAPYDQTSSPAFSTEQVLEFNPQVLFVQSPSDAVYFTTNPLFASLSAVQNHRIYVMPEALLAWGNTTTESPLVLLWAAKLLYPSYTKNIAIDNTVKTFYKEFFYYKFSTAQVKTILTPPVGFH